VNADEQTKQGRHLRGHLTFVGSALFAIAAGCSLLIDEHILTVRNETEGRVQGLVVRIKTREMPVPPLEPGASATIRMRINAESHWEMLIVSGDRRTLLGACGYTGTTPGRPSENTLRIVPASGGPAHDCVVSLG
jgi:hypothetical protein